MTMTFDEFESNVFGWSTDRKIIKNGKPYTQALKLSEEWGEVCSALAKNDKNELKDGLGDCSVLAINLSHMMGSGEPLDPGAPDAAAFGAETQFIVASIQYLLIDLFNNFLPDSMMARGRVCINATLTDLVFNLALLANNEGLDYLDCLAHAWNEIKDRKGELNELGVFVKEEDLQ